MTGLVRDRVSLRVSIVVYQPDLAMLEATLQSLIESAGFAVADETLGALAVDFIDNGTSDEAALDVLVKQTAARLPGAAVRMVRGQGNVGYGAAHNLSILRGDEAVHLVLNPDVLLAPAAVSLALRHLRERPDTALVTPGVAGADGVRQYLCRRYPSVLTLLLRGFAPPWLARRYAARMHHYEMRDALSADIAADVPIVSGCCMFVRGDALRRIGGFHAAYFLYFEDYDLSLRLAGEGRLTFVPDVRIVHHGGNAARKGARHQWLFIRSAVTFFRQHGWKL